ncbi:MAG: hypothetical protein QM504_10800, partial [Pseudomonadota bacterium]
MKNLITAIAICFALISSVQANGGFRHSGYESGHVSSPINTNHRTSYIKHRPYKAKHSLGKKHRKYSRHNTYYD